MGAQATVLYFAALREAADALTRAAERERELEDVLRVPCGSSGSSSSSAAQPASRASRPAMIASASATIGSPACIASSSTSPNGSRRAALTKPSNAASQSCGRSAKPGMSTSLPAIRW